MDFGFRYDRGRGLFSIVYNVIDGRLDDRHDAPRPEARSHLVALATGIRPSTGSSSHDH